MRNKLRRPLAFLLSAVMIVTMSGTPVHAVADRGQPETGLCEHHTAHTDDCVYTEETPGTPCGHEHTEDCYTKVTEYVHEHTPECYPEETEGSVSDNEATPANAEEREPVNCPHICDKESGCVTEKSDCQHEHDSECGYTESTPGTPCTYVCEICNPQDSSEADEEPETGIIKQEHCSCLTLCTEGQINPDCPVCGGSDAGLSDCKGKAAKEDAKQPEDTGICKHHQEHDDACGYQPESEDSVGSPCTYECRICPIEDLIAALPDKVTEDNAEDVRAQLDKILALFAELTEDEQEQLDLSRCYELQEALDGAKTPVPAEEILTDAVAEIVKSDGSTTYVGSLDDAFKAENSGAVITLLADVERTTKLEIKIDCTLDLGGHTITGTNNSISIVSGTDVTIQGEGGISSERSDALSVSGTVRLKGGVFSGTDGVFVESDGVLYVSGDVKIIGTVFYGLLCHSESVHLSGGTFQSPDPRNMIMPDKVLKNLLENGYAYFYNGQIPVTDDGLNGNQFGSWDYTSVMVKECSHTGDGVCEYTHTSGATTHKKTCLACGLVESAEKCSFDGIGKCSFCDAVLAVRLAADLALTYTGTAQTPAVTVTMDGQTLTAGNNYTVTYANNVNAGDTAKATVTGTAFEGTAELPFSIGKATPTVEWENDDVELTYTGQPADIKPAVTLVNGEAFSGMVTYTYGVYSGPDRPVNAGSYTVQASIPEQENYTAAKSGWMILTINKAAAPTITWPAANGLTYGQKLSESTLSGGSTEYGSFAWEKPDTVPTAGTAGHSVTFTPSNSTEQNYEPIATKTQDVDVTVAQATPTVTVAVKMSGSANSRVADLIITVAGAQNGAAPAGSITLTSDGLNETLTLQNGKAAYKWENLSDKEYTVTAAYSGDTNYKAANGQLTFDAAKKEQAALAISPVAAKTYGDPAFGLDTTGGSGTGAVSFTSSDPSIISINGSTATIHKAGTVTITARKAADNNYNEAVAAISLTIGKRPITVTADSFTVVKGAAMPTLDYQADGLVNNDTFPTDPIMTTSVSDTNTLGEYAIVISGGILTNGDSYQITYVNGKLTVTDKIPVQLTIAATPDSLAGGGTVTLTISGLPSGGEATVSCSDSSINVTGGGTSWKADLPNETATYTFTANYGGDVQHSSAVATCTVSVTKQTGGGSSGGGNGNSGGSGNGGGSSSGGNGSSSGDNGSSGGGSTIVARPDETKPDTPTTSQTKPATPDKNGNVAVDNGTVQSAINTAKNDAKKNGNTANGVAVVIPVTPKEGQNSFNVTINAQTLNTLVRENVKRLEINIEGVVVGGMDTKLLKWLDTLSANGDVIFQVKKTDPSGLSKEAKAAIGTRPVYDLSLVYLSGGKETPITDFGGHTIAVRLPYAPAKEEQAGNLYAVYVDGKGKVEWLTKSSYDPDLGTVVFETGHFSIYGIGYKNPVPAFTDIKNHWAADNIIFVASRGLLTGTGNNQFSPNMGMTRGMFVTALGRLAGIDPDSYKTGKFTDVKADAYYAPYVNWAAEKGIVNGTSATTFSPDTNITREQMAVIMANYAKKLGYDLPVAHEAVTFADNAQINGWAAKEVKAMQQAGILAGKGGNRFDPKGTATRAEVATVLRRFVEIVIDPQTAQGWMQNHSGSWQYMKNGKAATGWLQDNEKWYWLDNNGWMFAGGWKQIGGKWYYFYPDGSMAVNTAIDGYTIGPDGARKQK
ncbi:S-layer homology domain-containing protein [Anaerotruncus sp. 1XD42-93]|uniref:S-layer homology domain-containing protein n=1 Tax=Anaerotruncus sp. 1XD42-93 TaxID=2320853 RepID=UPI001412A0FF|nr:S-layer homology domain-containing protein [Anaerotruncus sp. 1XD42-93]